MRDDAPLSVATCDLDGDGDLDLVTANDASDTVTVLVNDGVGSFGMRRRWTVSPSAETTTEPVDVTCCDFNRDGQVDIVTANHTSDDVSILFGNGFDGGAPVFLAPIRYGVGEAPWAVRCLPLDEDIHPDILTADFTSNAVTVLINDGTGSVSDPLSYSLAVGSGPRSMALCDFDNDDDLDVATGDFSGKTISLLRNDGNAGLVAMESVPISSNPFGITCCDLDGLNGPDLITANLISDSVTVAYNQTGFAFDNLTDAGIADGAASVSCDDVTGDGLPDVVTGNLTSDDLSLFVNEGIGVLAAASPIAAGLNPSSIAVDRLVGGPARDVVVTYSYGVLVYENTCGLGGDADGDGDVDLADVSQFQVCCGESPVSEPCAVFDLIADDLIDLADFELVHQALTGP